MRLGIVVNPMSGRDVRRVAARASLTTHHDKQQQVTRLVLGALEQGVEHIYLVKEPFRINDRAVENLAERDRITLLEMPLAHNAADTINMTNLMWDEGCRTFIVLGGDGTNRIVADARPEAAVLPLSTGTNNVFPFMVEASVAGAAAGLVATGKVTAESTCLRAKRIHARIGDARTTALVDAAILRNDMLGSLLPFQPENIVAAVFAIAEPASIGVSPIGGFLCPTRHRDDHGLIVHTGEPMARTVRVPISAGLYGNVPIRDFAKLDPGEIIEVEGPGILACDGDRLLEAHDGDRFELSVHRDGPWIIEPAVVMNTAVECGALVP